MDSLGTGGREVMDMRKQRVSADVVFPHCFFLTFIFPASQIERPDYRRYFHDLKNGTLQTAPITVDLKDVHVPIPELDVLMNEQ